MLALLPAAGELAFHQPLRVLARHPARVDRSAVITCGGTGLVARRQTACGVLEYDSQRVIAEFGVEGIVRTSVVRLPWATSRDRPRTEGHRLSSRPKAHRRSRSPCQIRSPTKVHWLGPRRAQALVSLRVLGSRIEAGRRALRRPSDAPPGPRAETVAARADSKQDTGQREKSLLV